uniref:Zmp:0000001103 n=1 Tax=Sinocyclocheilus grahami TaxID=75366 RepID=A0A672KAP0_SINGR
MAADALWDDGRPVEAVLCSGKNIQHLHSLNERDCKSAEMYDDIYDDVIRTESERVEMMVAIYESADCVRGHNFLPETNTHQPLQQTGSDCVKIRSSRAAAVCLVLLFVLLLTAVIVLCVHIHTKKTNYREETHQLLTKINNLTEERDQDGLLIKNDNLTKQRDLHETDGWLYYKFSLYFISSESKSWTESRKFCTEKGADLIIINSREEQNFVKSIAESTFVWIGLTDSDVEGKWKRVDGKSSTEHLMLICCFRSWVSGEPNGQRKENCAVSYSSGWYDYQCNTA